MFNTGRAPDPRNRLDGPRLTAFRNYVIGICVLGVAVLLGVLALGEPTAVLGLGPAFWVAAGLLLLGESRPLFIAGARDATGIVLSTAFVFAMLLRYDLTVALMLQASAVILSDIGRHKAPWRSMFNIAQYSLSWLGAWGVLVAFHGTGTVAHPSDLTPTTLMHGVVAAVVFFVLNQMFVGTAIALRTGVGLPAVLGQDAGYQLLTTGALLAFGPLVVLAMEAGPVFVPLLLPPLAAVYAAGAVGMRSENQARTDSLTGLANRKQLVERVHEGPLALVLLDLDMFKEVNDTLGHHVGDQLLVAVARRLSGCVRPNDVVARLGGDEFALVLHDADVEAAEQAAARAREALATPFSLGGLLVEVAASAGIAVSPDHGMELEELLQRADVAMYLSKESGQVECYDAERDPNTPGRLVLLGALRRALMAEELVLHYQPKADVADGRIVGVEALVRWQHPELGLMMPDDFIPLAERSGLVTPLTAWVLDASLRQLALWRAQGWDICMAVNITAKDLCAEGFADRVALALTRHGLTSDVLQLELTEGSLFADSMRAKAVLKGLLTLGVSLSLDDFGTGWSSLVRLRELPVREIKVDRSFVGRMVDDSRDLAIVTSVIDLARGLGVRVVAEGVEDQDTWDALAALGCDRVQGYVLSPPLPAESCSSWLAERFAPVAQA